MSFGKLTLTNKGKALIAKMTAGSVLSFTRMKMGSGTITTQVISAMNDVITQVVSIKISDITNGSDFATIKGSFKNTAAKDTFTGDGSTKVFTLSAKPTTLTSITIDGAATTSFSYSDGIVTFNSAPVLSAVVVATYNLEGFYWREIGVFATDPDEGEIMFAYQNAYALAEYIAAASSEIVEKVLAASFIFDSASKVSAVVDPTILFITEADADKKYQKIATYANATLAASGWSNKTYSFESQYPVANYDITIAIGNSATVSQYKAFGKAQIVGSIDSNVIKALGTVPIIDIPVMIKVVKK
jgi:hypothetical protein